MLPLRSTRVLKQQSPLFFLLLGILVGAELFLWIDPATRIEFLAANAFSQERVWMGGLKSFLYHPHFGAFAINLLYWNAFLAPLFENLRGTLLRMAMIVVGCLLALPIYKEILGDSSAVLVFPEFPLSLVLGISLKKELFGQVLVLAPIKNPFRSVPSYVMIFIWFFYLFLGYLFSDLAKFLGPWAYAMAGLGLFLGFLFENLHSLAKKKLPFWANLFPK